MKKIFCIILLIATLFSISSCEKNEPEYERIQLNKDNYLDYLSIDVYVTDFSFVISKQTEYANYYDVSVVVHIETSKKVECTFEDVSITFKKPETAWQYRSISFPNATLNLNGESHTSYVLTKENCIDFDIPTSLIKLSANYVTIAGYVIVSKES